MEELQCVLKDISNSVKEEIIPDDLSLAEEGYMPREQSDIMLIKSIIKAEGISEESGVHLVVKEELIVENEDVVDEHTSSPKDAVITEDIFQQDISNRQSTMKQQEVDLLKIKIYQCEFCNKQFSYISSLSRHKVVHSARRTYKCEVCNKVVFDKRTLSVHRLRHSGVRKYKCNVCAKAFVQMGSLSGHKLVHNNNILPQQYQCSVCGKVVTHWGTLSSHNKVLHCAEKKYNCDRS